MYWYPPGSSLNDTKTRRAFVVQGGVAGTGRVPQKIEPGEVWTGAMEENEEYQQMLEEGTLIMALGFSHAKQELELKVAKAANK